MARTLLRRSLALISALLLTSSWWVYQNENPSNISALLAFLMPLLNALWVLLLLSLELYRLVTKPLMSSLLSQISELRLILGIHLLLSLIIWSPNWLFRSRDQALLESSLNEGRLINVMTYNLQRLGDLAPRAERAIFRQARVECLKKEIKRSGQILGAPIELFAFQEVNNHNLNSLENELNLTCQHIGYHSQSRRLGGLGVCVKRGGGLKINYVRNISLKGEGHWRALFAEVSFDGDSNSTFNLINVHFLPHGVGTRSVKSALLSPKSSYGLLRSIIKTSRKQREQAEGLLTLIKDYRDPTLLVGDFNAPPHGGAHPLLRAKWSDVWRSSGTNFGATKYFGGIIPFRIDFIYALKDAFDMIESRVSEAQCSDHNAVSATLNIK